MIIHTVTQGTTEWASLRAGIPTASAFDNIITPGLKPCRKDRSDRYMHKLIAERLLGRPVEEFQSGWMKRGQRIEPEAVLFYEAQTNKDTIPIGFVTNDDRTVGASPDRFVGDDGILEIKCPSDATHVGYLLNRDIDDEYRVQVQGQLWVAERQWAHVLSYHPEMQPVLMAVGRDDIFIEKLADAVEQFSRLVEQHWAELAGRGLVDLLRVAE